MVSTLAIPKYLNIGFELFGAPQSPAEPCGALQSPAEPCGALRSPLGPNAEPLRSTCGALRGPAE